MGQPVTSTVTASPSPVSYNTTRVLTVPNLLSIIRLLGIPLFLLLLLVGHHDVSAVIVLAVAGVTDFFDGFLARRWHQVSRLGQVLDPIADRSYILAIILGLAARGLLPWVLVIVLIARDVMLACLVPALRSRGYSSLPVHFLGKIATFCLLYAFPFVLLGSLNFAGAEVCAVMGWSVAIWGTFFYWWAGVLYMFQGLRFIHQRPILAVASMG
jgi:cardiolipin synthase